VAYEKIGEIKGALSRHADHAFQRLTPAEQEQARRVFVQLVNLGAGTEDTRRLASRSEWEWDWPLVAKLADERLVVTNQTEKAQDTVEVVHEALIRHWGRLQTWMSADRTLRAWQERLRFALKQWQVSREADALLRGAALAEAKGWLAECQADVSQAEQEFINASLAQRRQQERRQRLLLGGAVVTAQVMAILTGLSSWFYVDANQQRKTAEAAAATLAAQNEKAQAELNFYQTTDPLVRLAKLSKFFRRSDSDSQARARQLFFTLPKVDQLALLKVADERLLPVSRAVLPTLADVNRTGYTDEHLQALVDTLPDLPDAGDLPAHLEAWLAARQAARDKDHEAARAQYDELIKLDRTNPALLYERAGVLVALGENQAALADLEQVMTLPKARPMPLPGPCRWGRNLSTVNG
jgi:tetratricopeptide (TPR) repeat protein